MRHMLLALCVTAGFFGSANAETLNTTEIHHLKLERQALRNQRDMLVEKLVRNAAELDLLIRYANEENPSVLKDRLAPGGGTIAAGVVAQKYLPKVNPKAIQEIIELILAKLPEEARAVAKRSPVITSVVIAYFLMDDTLWYAERLKYYRSLDQRQLQDYYDLMIQTRTDLADAIETAEYRIVEINYALGHVE